MPLYKAIFDRNAPRLSQEATANFTAIGNWFAKENLTYVRVFGSLAAPHVLAIYVPNKLLAREVSYQTIGHGITKVLKDSKKTIWPKFPIHGGVYVLNNYNHFVLEIKQIEGMQLPTIPPRQYDSKKVIHDFTTQVKIRQFFDEPDDLNDYFETCESYRQVEHL